MSHRITDECIQCGLCEDECPEEAIIEGEYSYIIDSDRCIDCGACAEICTVEAVIESSD